MQPKSSQNHEKWGLLAPRAASGAPAGSRTYFLSNQRSLFGGIFRNIGDLGRHLGPLLGAKGVPKSHILAQVGPKIEKMMSRKEFQKKIRILIEI